jgi:hypothetical protein
MNSDEKIDSVHRIVSAIADDYVVIRSKLDALEATLDEFRMECRARNCYSKTLTPLPAVASVSGNGGEEPEHP